MRRNRELNCEDLIECDHTPEFPIADADTDEIMEWRCRCGQRVAEPSSMRGTQQKAKEVEL